MPRYDVFLCQIGTYFYADVEVITVIQAKARLIKESIRRKFIMGRIFKYLVYLVVLLGLGVLGYAYLGDMSAPQTEVSIPVEPQ